MEHFEDGLFFGKVCWYDRLTNTASIKYCNASTFQVRVDKKISLEVGEEVMFSFDDYCNPYIF